MKKKLVISICILLIFVSVVTSVSAASSVSISLSANDTSVGSGDKVTITVKATVDSCGSGGIELSYDSKVFELTSGEWLIDGVLTDFDLSSKDGVFALDADKKLSGKAFKFVLKVKSGAALGKSNVTVNFKADAKSVSKSISIKIECDHKYSNNCDTSCNSCGATRKITHKWNSGSVIKEATCTSTGSAKYTCTVCKETKTDKLSKTAHTYDHGCDTDCNVCGATREITHNYAWTCDSTNHWQACTVCGLEQEKSAHTLATEISGNAQGHGYLCSGCNLIPDAQPHTFDSACDADCADCDYVRPVEHYYNQRWSFDAEGHWYACALCGDALEKQTHTPGDAATETTDQICTTCGFIIVPAGNHVHSIFDSWLSDENGHWYLCRCGVTADPAAHIWDEGTVDESAGIVSYLCTDCGYKRAEAYVPETEPTQPAAPEPSRPPFLEKFAFLEEIEVLDGVPLWFVLCIVLCVSLVLNIVFIVSAIVIRVQSRRIKGKYE